MSTETAPRLSVSRQFDASAERVFDAWLDPATAGRWLFATTTGTMVRAEIDARVGGRFRFTDRRDGEDVDHVGEYLEIDRPRRLVFTFGVPKYSAEMTRVTVEIAPSGMGCELTLTHDGVLPEWREKTREGWGTILDGLARALRRRGEYGRAVAPDAVRFERLLPGPIERVWAYLTQSDKRAEWFAAGEMAPRAGAEMELVFEHSRLSPPGTPVPEKFRKYDRRIVSRHRITRVEPPHVLAFDWGDEALPSEVEFVLSEEGDRVRLVLTHRRLADRSAMRDVAGGWHAHLAVLSARLAGEPPQSFWMLFDGIEEDYAARIA